jgi:hypothetical protein
MAALQAGGMAALSARNQPGAWAGEKGIKVAGAAFSAAAAGAMRNKNNGGDDRGRDRDRDDGGRGSGSGSGTGRSSSQLGGVGSALGGFVLNQLASQATKRR